MENGRNEGAGLVMLLTIAVTLVFTVVCTVTLFAVRHRTGGASMPILAQSAPLQATPEPVHLVLSPTHTPPEWNMLAAQFDFAPDPACPDSKLIAEASCIAM